MGARCVERQCAVLMKWRGTERLATRVGEGKAYNSRQWQGARRSAEANKDGREKSMNEQNTRKTIDGTAAQFVVNGRAKAKEETVEWV